MKIHPLLLAALGSLALAGGTAAMAQPKPQAKPEQHKPQKAPAAPYGQWDKGWGTKPPAPPAHFAKKNDWYRHVRACQRKYRSYNARTDTYRSNNGGAARCRL